MDNVLFIYNQAVDEIGNWHHRPQFEMSITIVYVVHAVQKEAYQLVGTGKSRATKILSKAVGGSIFTYFKLRVCWPEVARGVLSGVAAAYVNLDVL